jgi:hypothetical protein
VLSATAGIEPARVQWGDGAPDDTSRAVGRGPQVALHRYASVGVFLASIVRDDIVRRDPACLGCAIVAVYDPASSLVAASGTIVPLRSRTADAHAVRGPRPAFGLVVAGASAWSLHWSGPTGDLEAARLDWLGVSAEGAIHIRGRARSGQARVDQVIRIDLDSVDSLGAVRAAVRLYAADADPELDGPVQKWVGRLASGGIWSSGGLQR